ncbi:2-succinyl-6-hydroxy-2,4-cyclohexadiene-1-carboxylate synthase [Lentzea xinjiangensis]|uniref:2-succinyl-6-hydroxy-2,4-cyclohexadiene-1-carboxylate synthase n=1 Tax=Lentzea xinjiangensis TaxID=402600 RepID=A0A1H9GM21_9PSEU|nr:alpha/beta hydrolase [Lentzea xinjiangensis]SEQ51157.1 2-succinyl-6-hydroxy-2,4-cyclohexadiene-1-carboxylate synthase [Lentzea xinjiangensis]
MWRERVVPAETEIFVAWREWPGERTVLAIHGGPDWDHSYLRDPLDRVACRLLMPDLRGCGRSGRVPEYHPDGVVEDLVRVLDAFEVERADVLGHSYGGMVAQRFAITHPSRVRSLVVAGSSVLPVPPDAFAGWAGRDEVLARQEDPWQRRDLSPEECVRAEAFAAAEANVRRPAAMPGYLRRLEEVRFGAEWVRQLPALVSPRLPDAARRIAGLGIPVLLLHGRLDMTFPAALVEPTLELIPRARAVVLEEAGHMLHVDEPEGFLRALREFLEGAAFHDGLELGRPRPV